MFFEGMPISDSFFFFLAFVNPCHVSIEPPEGAVELSAGLG